MLVEIYRWHVFYLWKWGRNVKELCRNPQWISPNNKVHCRVVTEINQFFGCYSLSDRQLNWNRFICQANRYLHSSSYHPYRCKKRILYSQVLRLNRICSKNNFFDIPYNNLEKWLSERGYSEKLVPKEILKARGQLRETVLDKEKMSRNDERVTFNITYCPIFKNIRNILEKLHILLAPDQQHRKVFTDIPRIGFKNGKSLKDHLVRSVLPKIDVAGNSGPCGGKRPPRELCKLMKKTSTFKKRNSDEIYHIRKPLNCNSKNTVYLTEYNQCWKQYTGSSTTISL